MQSMLLIIIFISIITIDFNGTEKKMTPVNYRNHLSQIL